MTGTHMDESKKVTNHFDLIKGCWKNLTINEIQTSTAILYQSLSVWVMVNIKLCTMYDMGITTQNYG